MMRRIRNLLLASSLLISTNALGAKPKIAVLPMQAVRVEASIVVILNDILTSEVANLGTYDVISSKEIDAMLGMEKMKSALGCDDIACLADIGGALGVDKMLTGSVGKLGSTLNISLTLFDMRGMKVEQRVRQKVETKEDLYEQAIVAAVKKLFGLVPPDSDTIQGDTAATTAAAKAPPATGATSGPKVAAADPGWSKGASLAGWILGLITVGFAVGSDIIFNIDWESPMVPAFGATATLIGGIGIPIVAVGGASSTASGIPAFRTAGWVAYASFWVAAVSAFVYRYTEGDFPVFAIIPGLVGGMAFALFALDASAAYDGAMAQRSGLSPVSWRILPTMVPYRSAKGAISATPGLAIAF